VGMGPTSEIGAALDPWISGQDWSSIVANNCGVSDDVEANIHHCDRFSALGMPFPIDSRIALTL
jgi:hypothetical protein